MRRRPTRPGPVRRAGGPGKWGGEGRNGWRGATLPPPLAKRKSGRGGGAWPSRERRGQPNRGEIGTRLLPAGGDRAASPTGRPLLSGGLPLPSFPAVPCLQRTAGVGGVLLPPASCPERVRGVVSDLGLQSSGFKSRVQWWLGMMGVVMLEARSRRWDRFSPGRERVGELFIYRRGIGSMPCFLHRGWQCNFCLCNHSPAREAGTGPELTMKANH